MDELIILSDESNISFLTTRSREFAEIIVFRSANEFIGDCKTGSEGVTQSQILGLGSCEHFVQSTSEVMSNRRNLFPGRVTETPGE
mmetsp:Transcript_28192/g.28478  ORF Transcript_28192/g.28478 Transcript_28192/m.28478 type:complete len:86 (+) Transcript_28192:218-475(+)